MQSKIQYSIPQTHLPKNPNETHIYSHPNQNKSDFKSKIKSKTLQDSIKKKLNSPNKNFLGQIKNNKIQWLTNQQAIQLSQKIGSSLLSLNLVKKISEYKNYSLQFLGIYSINTINYLLTDIACSLYNITIVPIYDTLGEEATEFAFE